MDEEVTKPESEQGPDVEHSTEDALGLRAMGHYGKSLSKGRTWWNSVTFKK